MRGIAWASLIGAVCGIVVTCASVFVFGYRPSVPNALLGAAVAGVVAFVVSSRGRPA